MISTTPYVGCIIVMLDTVKKLIDIPCISFEQFFQLYIMNVQDYSLDSEISFLLRNNFLSVNAMIKLANNEVGVL